MTKKMILIGFVLLLTAFVTPTMAATKEDVVGALNATYSVGSDSFRLPQSLINKGVAFLNSKEFTPEQYDKMLATIGGAVSFARSVGTTDITKISKEDLRTGIGIIQGAASKANINVSSNLGSVVSEINKRSDEEEKTENNNSISNATNNESNELGTSPSVAISSLEVQQGSGKFSGENKLALFSGDAIDLFLNNTSGDVSPEEEKVNKIVNRNITIVIVLLILILFILFFIIYLLFKSNWNRIVKYIMIIIFVILFLSALFVLGVGLYYIEEIRMIYKLYYMFN